MQIDLSEEELDILQNSLLFMFQYVDLADPEYKPYMNLHDKIFIELLKTRNHANRIN